MSRRGTANLVADRERQRLEAARRQQRMQSQADSLIRQYVFEMQPETPTGLADFMLESIEMTFSEPLAETLRSYETEIGRQGAQRLPLPATYQDTFRTEFAANVQTAAERGITLPTVLADTPPFVTRDVLAAQRDLSHLLQEGFEPDKARVLADQASASLQSTQRAYDTACLVAGTHLDDPHHAVFESMAQLLESLSPDTERDLRAWAEQSKAGLQREARETWAVVALAAAKAALEMTGFDVSSVDVAERTAVGSDRADAAKTLAVRIDPAGASLSYDLNGYQGKSCEKAERDFLQNLELVIGRSIPSGARVSRPVPEAYARPAEEVVTSRLADAAPPRAQQRERK